MMMKHIQPLANRFSRAAAGLEIACVLAFPALALAFIRSAGLRVIFVPMSLAFAVVLAWGCLRRQGKGWDAVGFAKPQRVWRTLLVGLVSWIGVTLVAGSLQPVIVKLIGQPVKLAALDFVRGNPAAFFPILLSVVWGSAAFGEELIFRGFVMNRLTNLFGQGRRACVAAVLVQAILFGLMHAYQGLTGILFTGIVGCLLGTVYWLAGRNLWVTIIAHGLLDTVSLTAIFLNLDRGLRSGGG